MAKLEQKIFELLKTRSPYQLGRKYAKRMALAGQVLNHPNFPKETKPGVFAGRERLRADFATMIHKLGAAAKSRDEFSKEVARGETRGREQAAGISNRQSKAGGVPTPRKRGAKRRKLTNFANALGFDPTTALHPLDPRSEKLKEALTGTGLEKYLKGAPTSKSGANRAAKNWNAMLKDFRAGKLPVGRRPIYPIIQRRLKQAKKISDHISNIPFSNKIKNYVIQELRKSQSPKERREKRLNYVMQGRIGNLIHHHAGPKRDNILNKVSKLPKVDKAIVNTFVRSVGPGELQSRPPSKATTRRNLAYLRRRKAGEPLTPKEPQNQTLGAFYLNSIKHRAQPGEHIAKVAQGRQKRAQLRRSRIHSLDRRN